MIPPSSGRNFNPVPSALPHPLEWIWAWSIPYRRVKDVPGAWEAVVTLDVRESDRSRRRCTYDERASFVLDTGSDVTVVPRYAFKRSFRGSGIRRAPIMGLTGGEELAEFYEATLSIPANSPRVPPFSFPTIEIAVVDRWHHEHGMLGLDALRKVLLISVERRVFLLPPEAFVGADDRR